MLQIKLKYTRQRIEDPNLHISWGDIVGDVSGNTALQDALDNKQNVGDYATHNDLSTVEDSLQNTINQTKDDINGELDKKQDKGNYALSGDSYTKQESDARYMKVGDVPTDVYTKTQVDDKLSEKLDINAYTPYDDTQAKADIAKKADKAYVDSELVKKQDKGDYALKSELPSVEGLATEAYVTNKIKEVVGTAPEALDTLGEIADKLSGDDDAIAAINQVLDRKVSKDEYNTNQQSINNSLTDLSNNKADKSEIPTIPLFRTINGQAITGDTTNIVIESGSDIELPISSDDVAVKVDILTKGKQLSNGDTFTSRYLFVELDNEGSAIIRFTDGTYISIFFGKIHEKSPEFSNATIAHNKNGDYVDFGDIVTLTLEKTYSTVYIGTTVYTLTNSLADLNNNKADKTALNSKQDTLVSGQNIKTVNGSSLLGSGNIYIPTINGYDMVAGSPKSYYVKSINNQSMFNTTRGNINVQPTLVSGTNIKTVNGSSLLGSGNLSVSVDELEADKVKFTTQGEEKVFVKGEEITDGYNNEHVQYILFINDSYGEGLTLTWDGGYSIHYNAFDKNVTFTNVEGTYEKYGEGEYVDDFIVKLNAAIPLNNVSISYDSAMSESFCHAYIATLEQEVKVETLPEVITNYYTKTEIDNMVGDVNNALNQI